MILFPLFRRRGITVWCLNVTGQPLDPEVASVYAVVVFDGDPPFVYVGQTGMLTTRIRTHLGGARLQRRRRDPDAPPLTERLARTLRRTRSVLVLALETAEAPGPHLVEREIAWQFAAALAGCDVPAKRLGSAAARGDADSLRRYLHLGAELPWPQRWLDVLSGYFRIPDGPGASIVRLSETRAQQLVRTATTLPTSAV